MKESIKKSPKSAMALYVKIYCQKHDRTSNRQYTLIEATKSWFSLSKTDKQYFLNVFQEYKAKMKKVFASNLQNSEPYMKRKHGDSKRLDKSKTTTVDYKQSTNEDTGINPENSHSICKDEHNEIEIQHDNEQLVNYDTSVPIESATCINTEPYVRTLNSEPIPPVRSSMELFEIIKNNDESTQHVNWADLTKLQKQRYQRALLRIKNDYLKQYTTYLEQLTTEQLFHYYKSKF